MAALAQAPALPLDEAGSYVAGAYVVFFALILVYVAIMAARLNRIERELAELEPSWTTERPATQASPDGEPPATLRDDLG